MKYRRIPSLDIESLKCPKCNLTVQEPFECRNCLLIFCRSCIAIEMNQNFNCPVCDQQNCIKPVQNRAIESILRSFEPFCTICDKNYQEGKVHKCRLMEYGPDEDSCLWSDLAEPLLPRRNAYRRYVDHWKTVLLLFDFVQLILFYWALWQYYSVISTSFYHNIENRNESFTNIFQIYLISHVLMTLLPQLFTFLYDYQRICEHDDLKEQIALAILG